MSRLRRALRRNYTRYLWLSMRQSERRIAKDRDYIRRNRAMLGENAVAAIGGCVVALMLNADQSRLLLGLDRGRP